MVRPPCEKQNARYGNWNEEEDGRMLEYVPKHRTGPKKCGRSCKHKWSNHLRPDKKHETFTPQEEELIINLHAAIGSRWSIIAQQLPGRTDSDVKNYWNSRLKKKLQEMGIDHVTHKPFSQIIADYGNIGAFPIPAARTGGYHNGDHVNNSLIQNQEKPFLQFSNYNSTSPKSFSSNDNKKYCNDTQSMDLLTQLQSITLVKQPPNCLGNEIIQQPQFYNEYPSSSSSSSPPLIVNEGWIPCSGFSWRDFLIEDAIPPQEHIEEVSPLGFPREVENEIKESEMKKEVNEYSNMTMPSKLEVSGTSAANSGSFVEAILDEEHDMFLDFPSLLEEPFYY